MTNLPQQFIHFIKKENLFLPTDTILLGVSGGADSAVLCALFATCKYNFEIAHCNFKLRDAESDRDENFVKQLSKQYNVPYHVIQFNTAEEAKTSKKSIEETARNLRYHWFKQLLANSNSILKYVATAHHADDCIETVTMQFFRGTGVHGLTGIPVKNGHIIRPLLFARRQQIIDFATENNIDYVTDSTNAQSDYTRNYCRNQLLPSIKKMYSEAENNILHNIERFKDVAFIYQESILKTINNLVEKKGEAFHIPVLKLAKTKPLSTIIYEIIKPYNFTSSQVNEVEKLLVSESGKYITSTTHRILLNRKWLIIAPLQNSSETNVYVIEKDTKHLHFALGELTITTINKPETLAVPSNAALLNADDLQYPLLLRKYKTGDYFYPLGMQNLPTGKVGKKKLSRFFVDLKLSLIQKENVWVIESNKKIVWVVGYRIDDRFKITPCSKCIVKLSLKN